MVKGKRGRVPEYRWSDVKRRIEAGARPGMRLGDVKSRSWEQLAVYDVVNHFLLHPIAAHAVVDFAIDGHVAVDELCSVLYERLSSLPRTKGAAERFRALCLAATNVSFDWKHLAAVTRDSPSECDRWTKFVRSVLPMEYRGETTTFEYKVNRW